MRQNMQLVRRVGLASARTLAAVAHAFHDGPLAIVAEAREAQSAGR